MPRFCAVAMACKPAAPAPMTSTLAARSVPAAVMSIGKILGDCSAARMTALYPARLACDDRASIACVW